MEEGQVDREVVVDLEAHLAAHDREATSELGKGLLDPVHERLLELELGLGLGFAEAEEVEDEGLPRELLGELGLRISVMDDDFPTCGEAFASSQPIDVTFPCGSGTPPPRNSARGLRVSIGDPRTARREVQGLRTCTPIACTSAA